MTGFTKRLGRLARLYAAAPNASAKPTYGKTEVVTTDKTAIDIRDNMPAAGGAHCGILVRRIKKKVAMPIMKQGACIENDMKAKFFATDEP